MIMSAGGPMQHITAPRFVNNELEKMWKELVIWDNTQALAWRDWREKKNLSGYIYGVVAQIWIKTSPK
jgi:hypothetical protein